MSTREANHGDGVIGPACLAEDTLVSYLYDECAADERRRIDQHLTSCAACAAEVEGLGGTRAQLSSWVPPDAALGFRVTAAAVPEPAPASAMVARLPWWRQPMPAWAQAVAATVLFGLGMAAGGRGPIPVVPAASQEPATAISARDLSSLESRLRREIGAIRTAGPVSAAPAASTVRLNAAERDALMRQVRQLVRESEDRQQQAFTMRAAQVARDAEIQRRVDVANLRQTLMQVQGTTTEEVRRQREMLNYLVNVSQQR